MYGEGYMLLFGLIYTSEETGAWSEIKDPEVRLLVLNEIEKIRDSKSHKK